MFSIKKQIQLKSFMVLIMHSYRTFMNSKVTLINTSCPLYLILSPRPPPRSTRAATPLVCSAGLSVQPTDEITRQEGGAWKLSDRQLGSTNHLGWFTYCVNLSWDLRSCPAWLGVFLYVQLHPREHEVSQHLFDLLTKVPGCAPVTTQIVCK